MKAATLTSNQDRLVVENLKKRFGGLTAVDDCCFNLADREIVGLIGPNGSGKTTVFNLIMGLLKADEGKVFFEGNRIDSLKPYQIAQLGVGRTFQNVRIFRELTLVENMAVASLTLREKKWEERAFHLLELVKLVDKKSEKARNLSFGQQRLLEIAMALLPNPRLLMFDEPVAGVHPTTRDVLSDLIIQICQQGRSLLIIEHNIPFVMDICHRIIVLHHGKKIAEGNPMSIQDNDVVIDAYLGKLLREAKN